jgi:DNA polymerase III sliding clamp (beta) subunit (PCNA family)
MKVILNRKPLLKLLDRCLPAAQDGTLPHGKTVLLTAEKQPDQLRLSAVGIALAVDTCHVAQVDSVGSVLVEALRLRSLIEAMPDEAAVTLALGKERLTVQAANRRYTVSTMDVSAFPSIPEIPDGNTFDETTPAAAAVPTGGAFAAPHNETPYLIPCDALAQVLEATQFAMDDAKEHEHLNGVLLTLSPGQLHGVALNGHCAAESTLRCSVIGQTDLFVPHSIQRSILSLCGENKNLRCDKDERRLYIETDDTLLSVALPAAPFPNWSELSARLIYDPVCAIDGDLFARAVKAMLTVNPQATIALELEPPILRLTMTEKDGTCDGDERIEAQVSNAEARFSIKLNGGYLANALKPCSIAELCVGDPNREALGVRAQDRTFYAAIMPIVY